MYQNNTIIEYFKQSLFVQPRFKAFIHTLISSTKKRYIFFLYVFLCFILGICTVIYNSQVDPLTAISSGIKYIVFIFISWTIIFIIFSNAFSDYCFQKQLQKIGFHNHKNEYPVFTWHSINENIIKLHFYSPGIPLDKWKDSIPLLENVLNITIGSINLGKRSKDICITCCRGKYDYNQKIIWHNDYLADNALLIIGDCLYNPITINFSQDAHVLIGGATGSGKTYLLKHLLMQCVQKNYAVIIADFKGGIDFPHIWHEKCVFFTKETDVIDCLRDLSTIIDERKSTLGKVEAKDIDEFNDITGKNLQRYIFACDELAELLDCTGLTKEEKEQKREITRLISNIARIGRAYGVHLILSTQRPDADIVPGQIKNNITYRICGKADDTLSRIILDNTQASDRIPVDSVGVFLDNHGNLIKGYVFDERNFF